MYSYVQYLFGVPVVATVDLDAPDSYLVDPTHRKRSKWLCKNCVFVRQFCVNLCQLRVHSALVLVRQHLLQLPLARCVANPRLQRQRLVGLVVKFLVGPFLCKACTKRLLGKVCSAMAASTKGGPATCAQWLRNGFKSKSKVNTSIYLNKL